MTLLDTSVYSGWVHKQAAQGTPGTAGSARRQSWISDDFGINIDDGSLQVSDLSLYGVTYRYRNTVSAQGNPQFVALPSETAYQMWLAHGGETVTGGTNELQTLSITGTPTAGTFKLSYTYVTAAGSLATLQTATIAFNAAASAVQTALTALAPLTGNVTAAGGPLPGTPVTLTFNTGLASKPQRALVPDSTLLTGGTTPTAAVVRTTPGVKIKHLFKPTQGTAPFWYTFWRRVGLSPVDRARIVDCLTSGWTLSGGNGDNKIVRFVPNILGLSPQAATADPSDAFPTEFPWLYTDAVGTWAIGGEVYSGQQQFTINASQERTPVYGDSVVPVDLAAGNAQLTVGTTLVVNQQALDLRNEQLYGSAAPVANTAPLSTIPDVVTYTGTHKQREADGFLNGNDIKVTFPGIQLSVPPAPAPNIGGGDQTIEFAGTLFPVAGQDPYNVEIWCDEVAFT